MNGLQASGPVLHPTDFSAGARAAYPYALYLAGLLDTDLRVLHVETGEGESETPAGDPEPDPADEVQAWLASSRAGEAEPPEVRPVTRREPDAAEGILEDAAEVGAATICAGTHGRTGLRRLVLGSIAERVLREVRCPVLTVREGISRWGRAGPRRLLAAVDLSPMARPTLAWAGRLAALSGAELEAAHVVTSTAAAASAGKRQRIHATFRDLDLPGVELDTRVLAGGDPADRVRAYARDRGADLVVVGTHGRSGPSRLVFGSVAEALVRRSPCPVFTVSDPPPGVGGETRER